MCTFSSMEEVQEEILPPFWLQSSQADRRLRRSYSLFLSSGALLIFILATATVLIFIIVPTLVSFTSQIFKPHFVKKSWDFLNLMLVLFAVDCGFLNRNSNESPRSYEDENFSNARRDYVKSNPETPRRWNVSADCTPYRSFNRLRSINSYPDLRQESSWVSGNVRWRFYDDTHISRYHGLEGQLRTEADEEEMAIKIKKAVDTFIACTEEIPTSPPQPQLGLPPSPPQPPSSSPPTQPTKAVRRRTKRTYQAVEPAEKSDKQENNDLETENFRHLPSKPLPPPLALVFQPVQESNGKNEKKRDSATKDFLTTLRRRKKKQTQKSIGSFETILNSEVTHLPSKPLPAPPPPPLPSPPPPQPRISSMPVLKTKSHIGGVISYKPHIPNKRETSKLEENVIANNESQLNLIPPPPPPPPPFKMPVWKFRVQGDYVRVDSIGSSRSSSPDLDEVGDLLSNQTSPLNSPSAPNGEESTMPLFCSSPDVDTKADTFIARFRAGLRLEKINSMKEKNGIGKSNLGPSSNPSLETKETAVPS